uniref:Type II toxin-antitoxin system RelE/ParE family toxin n=1 Tax=Acinetobacter johnsonii TaxID=40214 RepID=C9WPS7_ACIJO|nr:unknown [Acinetobacter johnsonii]
MDKKFRVEFMEEAAEFLDEVGEKATNKILYNIHKSQVHEDKELFKKLNTNIWEFRTLFNKTSTIDFLHFGTRQKRTRVLLFQLMESSRKLTK